ncbi:MAG: helix-turn-helix transcriptional regulator [Anaerolineales bacterium]
MNRTDRLLALLLELQRGGTKPAAKLAEDFATSKRTIYRDVLALMEAGVPVLSTPGQGYALDEGYFLPPLRFTTDEAALLLLGAEFMAQNFDSQYRAAAELAGKKIEAVLSKARQAEVAYLRDNIRFIAQETLASQPALEKLRALRSAVVARNTVRFRYHARTRPEDKTRPAVREVDPYTLAFVNGAWYLLGHDHARRALRNFRLDRLEAVTVLQKTFARPSHYRVEDRPDDRRLIVRVLFDLETARWAQEARPFFWEAETLRADGLFVTLRVRFEADALEWLASWGSRVRVLEPASLRQRLADDAAKVLRMYE